MNEIVVLDLINNDRTIGFCSVEKAEKWILDNYSDEVEGIHPDIESVQILQVLKRIEVEELDNKKHKISFVPVESPVKPEIANIEEMQKELGILKTENERLKFMIDIDGKVINSLAKQI
jgi:hypothetical protein